MRRVIKTETSQAEASLRAGDFAGAWRAADVALRARSGRSRPHLARSPNLWDGSPLAGRRVLVRCHHGWGALVQHIRYVRPLQAIARRVVTMAPAALIPLLRTMPGHGRLLPLEDEPARRDYDVEIELLELPHYFRATLETLPGTIPYFLPPRARLSRRHAARPAVGLAWATYEADPRRSIAPEELAPLTRTGVELFLLQRGAGKDAWPFAGATDVGSDDPLSTASTIRALDLVIAVDSFPAHLAGALGVPAWTLLPHHADCRWMVDRADSPWYPTMRLFRQARAGDWRPVIEEVAAGLALRALHSTPGRATHATSR